MEGFPAALKLVKNLLEQFEPEDAQMFAAFVLAKVSYDAEMSIQKALQATATQWAQLALSTEGESGKTIEGDNCVCGIWCVVKQTPHGPLVMHHGAACKEFKDRFPLGHHVRAQDGVGWTNWYASEKQDPPDQPTRWDVLEMDRSNSKKVPTADADDAKIRFSMLELDPISPGS
jgi:hypothetical protein